MDEETLGKIQDVPGIPMRTVMKQHPLTEFMIDAYRVGGTAIAGVR